MPELPVVPCLDCGSEIDKRGLKSRLTRTHGIDGEKADSLLSEAEERGLSFGVVLMLAALGAAAWWSVRNGGLKRVR